MFKKGLALVITVAMVLAMVPAVAFAATTYSDMPNDWSTTALENAVKNGLISGYPDGTIRPGKSLTRAEMITIVANAFGAVNEADISKVQDVKKGDWYYSYVAKSIGMEGIAFASVVRPNDPITREEAFTVLAKVFLLKNTDNTYASLNKAYSDANTVSGWAKGFLNVMSQESYINGHASGKVSPLNPITRAEFSSVMDNMFKQYVEKPATDTKMAESGNVVVRGAGTLKDVTVNGDLVIADGVNKGTVVLDNINVKGRLVVRGGVKIEFTGKVNGDIVLWADNCTVYANSGASSFANGVVTGTNSKIVTPGGGGGGGGGGQTTTYDYRLGFNGKFNVTLQSGREVTRTATASVGYNLNDSVYSVAKRLLKDESFRSQVEKGIDQAIKAAEGRLLNEDGYIEIGIAAPDDVTKDVITSPEVKAEVVDAVTETIKDNLPEGVKVDDVVSNVLNALVDKDANLDYTDANQQAVVKELNSMLNKADSLKPEKLQEKIEDKGYGQYLDMIVSVDRPSSGATEAEKEAYNQAVADALQSTLDQYSSQLDDILKQFEAAQSPMNRSIVIGKDSTVLQTIVYVDPVTTAQKQYNASRAAITARLGGGSTAAEVEKLLNAFAPDKGLTNGDDGSHTFMTASQYYNKLVSAVDSMYTIAGGWQPGSFYPDGTSRDEAIDQMVEAMFTYIDKIGGTDQYITTERVNMAKAVMKAFAGTDGNRNLKMSEFLKKINRNVDPDKTWDENDAANAETKITVKASVAGLTTSVANQQLQQALDWLKKNYGDVKGEANISIDWVYPEIGK